MKTARVSKVRYEQLLPQLRDRLLDAQFDLLTARTRALAIILTGVPSAGRSEAAAELTEWLDPKLVDVHAYAAEKGGALRPPFWRYWQDLPAKGRIGIFFGAWYEEWMRRESSRTTIDRRAAARTRKLEAMLVADGIDIVKIHLHVPADLQRKRLRKLARNPLTRWRVTADDLWLTRHAKLVKAANARCVAASDHPAARWTVVDGSDPEFRSLAVSRRVATSLEGAVQRGKRKIRARPMRIPKVAPVLPVDRSRAAVLDEEYEQALLKLQGKVARLARAPGFLDRGAILVFEGSDAAGKGGAIRRLVHALDVRQYRVVPVSAPSAEERGYPYLWRFWGHIPPRGQVAVFDRSWYGRVLVERVRGFTAEVDWSRAFDEINEFEQQLTEHGYVLAKFWLDVSPPVQLARFRERNANPLKRFKVDPEDWINRRFHRAYQLAAKQMFESTSTASAPWTLVDADNKHGARLAVLAAVADAIERIA